MGRSESHVTIPDEGPILTLKIDGDELVVAPSLMDMLRMKAIVRELNLEGHPAGQEMPAELMAPLCDGLIEHVARPHTAQIRALNPRRQMHAADALLAYYNEVIGDAGPTEGPIADPTPESSESAPGPANGSVTSSPSPSAASAVSSAP